MLRVRLLFGVLSLLLATACNSLPETPTASLAPQFSDATPGAEAVYSVAASTEGVYIGGLWNDSPALVKFSRSGRIPWVKGLPRNTRVQDVATGPGGAVYLLYTVDDGKRTGLVARRYSPMGAIFWTRPLGSVANSPGGYEVIEDVSASTDSNGNLYLSATFELYLSGEFAGREGRLQKYWANGALAWQKRLDSSEVNGSDVSTAGFSYVLVSRQGDGYNHSIVSYSPNGAFRWRAAVPISATEQALAVGRDNEIYVAADEETSPATFEASLFKYNNRGERVWRKFVGTGSARGLNGAAADNQGNVFLGFSIFSTEPPNGSQEFYSFNANGARLVQRELPAGADDPRPGEPAVLSSGEVYYASSAKTETDARLFRLSGLSGAIFWQR